MKPKTKPWGERRHLATLRAYDELLQTSYDLARHAEHLERAGYDLPVAVLRKYCLRCDRAAKELGKFLKVRPTDDR